MNMELAWRGGLVVYECIHLTSVMYCASCASSPLLLEETLAVMVNRKWLSEDITLCISSLAANKAISHKQVTGVIRSQIIIPLPYSISELIECLLSN